MDKINPFAKRWGEIYGKKPVNLDELDINYKKLHLDLLIDKEYLTEISDFLLNSCWIFYYNNTRVPRVFETDKYFNDLSKTKELRISGLISPMLDINFPLSPRINVRIIRDKVPSYKHLVKYNNRCVPVDDDKIVKQCNLMQCRTAYKYVFISPKNEYMVDDLINEYMMKGINVL